MIGRLALRIRRLMMILLLALAAAPMTDRALDGGARSGRGASDAAVLAQRCITYKGELQCF